MTTVRRSHAPLVEIGGRILNVVNRAGEFALVIDPGNDGHIVAANAVAQLLNRLEDVIQVGLAVTNGRHEAVTLYLTTSPEYGSVRLSLMAATAAAFNILSAAADVSQVTGVNLKDVFQAVNATLHAADAPPKNLSASTRVIAQNDDFADSALSLAEQAMETGYDSIRIEGYGTKVELIRSGSGGKPDEVARLRHRLAVKERRLEAMNRRPAPQMQPQTNVIMTNDDHAILEHEISYLRRQIEQREAPSYRSYGPRDD